MENFTVCSQCLRLLKYCEISWFFSVLKSDTDAWVSILYNQCMMFTQGLKGYFVWKYKSAIDRPHQPRITSPVFLVSVNEYNRFFKPLSTQSSTTLVKAWPMLRKHRLGIIQRKPFAFLRFFSIRGKLSSFIYLHGSCDNRRILQCN